MPLRLVILPPGLQPKLDAQALLLRVPHPPPGPPLVVVIMVVVVIIVIIVVVIITIVVVIIVQPPAQRYPARLRQPRGARIRVLLPSFSAWCGRGAQTRRTLLDAWAERA